MRYIVLLRGVNVGGNHRVVMADLRDILSKAGYKQVVSYINSGNLLVDSDTSEPRIAQNITSLIKQHFSVDCDVLAIEGARYIKAIETAPSWWGSNPQWKHNALFVLPPTTTNEVVEAIGELKPGIERIHASEGVIFQSMSFEQFGKTTTGKLASSPIYKRLTIRNFNTTKKLVDLLKQNQI